MSEGPSRAVYSAEDVIDMVTLEDCDDNDEDDVDEVFFPGSDDERDGISESEIYTYYALCNTTCVFLHAQKVPHNYIPLSAKKKYTIVMKKVHEQVAKTS